MTPVRSHPCPVRLSPYTRSSCPCMMWNVPHSVGSSRPCCHPHGGHPCACRVQPKNSCRGRGRLGCRWRVWHVPCLVVASVLALCDPLVCCTAPFQGSPHSHVWGGPISSLLAACMLPSLVLFSLRLVHSLPLVCFEGGTVCSSLPPMVVVGLPHCCLGYARGTRRFCTCLQICKKTGCSCLSGW